MILSGDLQAPQVNDLWQRRADWWQDDRLELGAVTTLDSAGLALLVKWAKAALARGATPTLVGASRRFPYAGQPLQGWPASFIQPRSQLRTHNASL